MIRNAYIQRKVLEIYQNMDEIVYPVRPKTVLQCMPKDCRILSYREMADATGCSKDEIAAISGSNSGATHYDTGHDRYLIVYNENMNDGRILWTIAHEIGHICLGHINATGASNIAFSDDQNAYSQLESEADCFAWNLLAPLPILRETGIKSANEISIHYGLSKQAATLHFERYQKWCSSHVKTAFETEMIRNFREKYTC